MTRFSNHLQSGSQRKPLRCALVGVGLSCLMRMSGSRLLSETIASPIPISKVAIKTRNVGWSWLGVKEMENRKWKMENHLSNAAGATHVVSCSSDFIPNVKAVEEPNVGLAHRTPRRFAATTPDQYVHKKGGRRG
jgi:hypothetical protein